MNFFLLLACTTQEFQPSEESPRTESPIVQNITDWEVLLTGSLNGEYEPCG